MPRKPKQQQSNGEDHGGDTASLNVSNRAETIRRACREITDLEAQRKSISQDIASVKQMLVKGVKIADFNVALRMYQLEGDDRETFAALGVGEQLDFLDAMGDNDGAGDSGYDAE